ncbi:MAG TPA: hypothetical protein PK250_12810 [Syntrophobacter fumaroxidans]|nr:hypothetical protein [Syntrophobacter fumaroxidans]
MTERGPVSWLRRNAAIAGVVVALGVHAVATIRWTATLDARVQHLEERDREARVLVEQIPLLKKTDDEVLRLLEKMSCDLGKINDRLWNLRFTEAPRDENGVARSGKGVK